MHYVISFTDITELKKYAYKLNYQATHDNLTQLYNRQKLNDELEKEIARQKRYGHPFSLVMFDIDNFKSINDQFGHDVGDIVLKELSLILQKTVRSTDFSARWGGEEFMILLPETDINNALSVANNIRADVESINFGNIMDRNVTISVGVSTFKDGDDKISILKRIDVALYKAKENGKNQVVQL
jgi:diguanylate cyclase (GGDEF)-like protein